MNIEKKILRQEKTIGYSFKKRNLLQTALTHSSYAYEHQNKNIQDNEVLEFLGDSILGLIIARYLYDHYPHLDEGDLSKLKSAAASTNALCSFAQNIHLDKKILLGKGEQQSDGHKKKTILAGAFEALVAAIYLDGGIEKATEFTIPHLKKLFKKLHVEKFSVENYKSALQEYFQRDNLPSPAYKTINSKGPEHKKSFTVEVSLGDKILVRARGSSKKEAEQKAAQKALKKILGNKIKTLTEDIFIIKRKQ
ncbi:MAG: ribonuclease III [Acidobacteriota bacterium]